jgi:hypothetical protein
MTEYTPSPKVIAWAAANGWNAEAHVEFFVDYLANRTKKPYKDLDAAFRQCVRSDWGHIRAQMTRSGTYMPKKVTEKPINGMVWDKDRKEWVRHETL